jgi:hypothetical protein
MMELAPETIEKFQEVLAEKGFLGYMRIVKKAMSIRKREGTDAANRYLQEETGMSNEEVAAALDEIAKR